MYPSDMSYTAGIPLDAGRPAEEIVFTLSADAAFFSRESIRGAADRLGEIGGVEPQQLYQFSALSTCRIIIAFWAAGLVSVAWNLVSAALYDCLRYLLDNRSRAESSDESLPPQIEFRVRRNADGSMESVFIVRSDDESVLRAAIEGLGNMLEASPTQTLWDGEDEEWREPD